MNNPHNRFRNQNNPPFDIDLFANSSSSSEDSEEDSLSDYTVVWEDEEEVPEPIEVEEEVPAPIAVEQEVPAPIALEPIELGPTEVWESVVFPELNPGKREVAWPGVPQETASLYDTHPTVQTGGEGSAEIRNLTVPWYSGRPFPYQQRAPTYRGEPREKTQDNGQLTTEHPWAVGEQLVSCVERFRGDYETTVASERKRIVETGISDEFSLKRRRVEVEPWQQPNFQV